MSFGFSELLVVGVVALLVFGGNLPDVMRTLGRTYAKFRQSLHEISRPVREEMREITTLPPRVPPVKRDEGPPVPEYPDHTVAPGSRTPEVDATAGAKFEDTPPPLEIDEPPPV